MSEANEVIAKIREGNRYVNFVLSAGAQLTLQLIQYLMRLQKEKLLSGGEIEDMAKFAEATKGEFDIVEMPFTSDKTREEVIANAKQALNERKIRYHILPCNNPDKQAFQICIMKQDAGKFSSYFQDYILGQLQGGAMSREDLEALTGRKCTIVSVPFQDDATLDKMMADLTQLKVNFSKMPDLNFEDNQTQFLIANDDISLMKNWYARYEASLRSAGEEPEPMMEMNMEQYQATGHRTADEYINGQSKEIAHKMEHYDNTAPTEKEEIILGACNQIVTEENPRFAEFANNPNYQMISIDAQSLMHSDSAIEKLNMSNHVQKCIRIPGTFGGDVQIIQVNTEQMFKVEGTEKERYIAFIEKNTSVNGFVRIGGKLEETEIPFGTIQAAFDNYENQSISSIGRKVTSVDAPQWTGKTLNSQSLESTQAAAKKPERQYAKPKNQFLDFPQRKDDSAELEKLLLKQIAETMNKSDAVAEARKVTKSMKL